MVERRDGGGEKRGRSRPEEGGKSGRRGGHRAGESRASVVSVRLGFSEDFADEPEPTKKAVMQPPTHTQFSLFFDESITS